MQENDSSAVYNDSMLLCISIKEVCGGKVWGGKLQVDVYRGSKRVNGYGITTSGLILECSVLGYGIVGAAHIGNQFVGCE